MTCGRNASRLRTSSGSKKRRRRTTGTSSFWTGCTPSLALPPEHVGELGRQAASELAPLLVRIGGQNRGDQRRGVHLAHRLRQVLEEVDDAPAPDGIEACLLAGIHQHFVHQDEGGQAAAARYLQQRGQQRLRGRRLALLVEPAGVQRAQPVRPRELEREHAPRMAQRAGLPVRPAHPLDAPLRVDLVEAERGRERPRQLRADVLPELPHRRQVRQPGRVAEQVVEGDQRVRLPAAVGQLELPHRLVAPPRQPRRHVAHQLAQRVRGIRQGEELRRILVHWPPPLRLHHLVQVGRELGQRQFTRPQLVLQVDDFVPGTGAVRPGHRAASSAGSGRGPAVAGVLARCDHPERRDACMRRIIGGFRPS